MPLKKDIVEEFGAVPGAGDRIEKWRKQSKLKGYELARKIGISQGSLSDIQNNKSLPSADTLARFHQLTDINIIWILNNKGPMLRPKALADNEMDVITSDPQLRKTIALLVNAYEGSDRSQRKYISGFLEGIQR